MPVVVINTMALPINIHELLSGKGPVESERLEFKKGWNPEVIMRSVCAFANDIQNLGSGYIIIGIEEDNGMAKRPVLGFPAEEFDKVQKEMLNYGNLMRPAYHPLLSLEEIDDKHVLVIRAQAGTNRPYEVPKNVLAKKNKEYHYYIRQYSNTVQANAQQRQELIGLTANVPFDDRVNRQATLTEIEPLLIQYHLREVKSKLYEESRQMPLTDLCRNLNLVEGPDEELLPKNVALMMFNDQPHQFFPECRINVAEFPQGLAEDFYEKNFTGPIQIQLKQALSYLQSQVIKEKIVKVAGQAEARRFFNYPYEALEEALANAVYHRNYEEREPIEVRVLPEAIEIISFGGPDASIRISDLEKGRIRVRRYRNRRIGEFLKELHLTEGKGTGIPTIQKAMKNNGSPAAKFETDEGRTYFVTELPVHEDFLSSSDRDSDRDSDRVSDRVRAMIGKVSNELIVPRIIQTLEYCQQPKSREEILHNIGLKYHSKNFNTYIRPALDKGLLKMTQADKPNSRNQKYYTTQEGLKVMEG